MMSGVTLIGHSASLKDESIAGEEKYGIEKVSKLGRETWLFHVHIQYGSHDIPVPLPVTIKWAGDTPVITITNLTIPGLGTYTARVLLYDMRLSTREHGAAKITGVKCSERSSASVDLCSISPRHERMRCANPKIAVEKQGSRLQRPAHLMSLMPTMTHLSGGEQRKITLVQSNTRSTGTLWELNST